MSIFNVTGVIKAASAGVGFRMSLGSANKLNFTFTITAPTPSGSAGGGTPPFVPFGSRLTAYVSGLNTPTITNASQDAHLVSVYDAWKAHGIKSLTAIAGGQFLQFSNPTYAYVSEGMGYAMLLAVLFAGHDANAQQVFDGLLTCARARPAYSVTAPYGNYLMDWHVFASGAAGDGWNAMDGDLDMAMALLMANRQWGNNNTTWNYSAQALNTIGALKAVNFKSDGTSKGLPYSTTSRVSDYMLGHFRAFKAFTGDAFWDSAVARSYQLIDLMQTSFSSAGLVPDFIINTNGELNPALGPYPSTGGYGYGDGAGAVSGYYYWNSCRVPWRIASEYVYSGNISSYAILNRFSTFFKNQYSAAGNSVWAIKDSYYLNGTPYTNGNSAAYMAPIMIGAMIAATYQALFNALWGYNVAYTTTGYYDGEIQLLSKVVATGNWWNP